MQGERGVRVHRSWIPAAALVCAHLAAGAFASRPLALSVVLALAATAAIFGSVVLHELAHAGMVRRRGQVPASVTVQPFGGATSFDPADPKDEAVVAAAGTLTSLALGGACMAAASFLPQIAADLVRTVGIGNLALAALSALPVFPLDGGRFARATLWASAGDRARATRKVARWGLVIGTGLVVAGALVFAADPQAPIGWTGLWAIVAGVVVWRSSRAESREARVLAITDGRTTGLWAHPFAGRLGPDDVIPASAGIFAVADGGRLAGIASGVDAGRPAREAMVPWSSHLSVTSSDPLRSALERMATLGTEAVVVLDDDGVVRGVLSKEGVRTHVTEGR